MLYLPLDTTPHHSHPHTHPYTLYMSVLPCLLQTNNFELGWGVESLAIVILSEPWVWNPGSYDMRVVTIGQSASLLPVSLTRSALA